METPQLPLSPTVQGALKVVGPDRSIDAASFCLVILKQHPEYAGHRAASLGLNETQRQRKAQDWIEDVQSLVDPLRLQEFSKTSNAPQLHGRLMILGLCLLDPELYQQLEKTGAFPLLVKELNEPLDEILTSQGKVLLDKLAVPADQSKGADKAAPPELFDSVRSWSDDELKKNEDDLLGRAAFARFLAKRLMSLSPEEGAYVMHLYGPWGSGKSTVLNFLGNELKKQESLPRWEVVDFNAWRHQHIDPPWWSLLESVFQGTRKHLTTKNRLREYFWRFNTGRIVTILSLIIVVWLIVLGLAWVSANLPTADNGQPQSALTILGTVAEAAKNLGEIIALVVTVWGSVVAINRSVLLGGARAAQNYKERVQDPMNEIKKHFNGLIRNLLPKWRVAIFVDDLDRCRSGFVVELLEGIQTLFREAPVVFIVAADRRWLNACYELEYEKFKAQVSEPGKPLGTLFLEKAFRFSTPLPGIPGELKQQYWWYLLQIKGAGSQEAEMAQARTKASAVIAQAHSEEDVQKEVRAGDDSRSFVMQRAIREAAVERLAAPEIVDRLEHTLKPYAGLLEQNPREMKQLVNTYSANRALAFLAELEIERHQLVLWTILSLRWPQLAEYLEEKPEMSSRIGTPDQAGIRDDLRLLFMDPHVIEVACGIKDAQDSDLARPLEPETIRRCAQMRA
jgi:energy-coupling factor transporter ATP-binding protein EcfA2